MTIGKLKELIKNIPDNKRLYLDDGMSLFEGNEVVALFEGANGYDDRVVIQSKLDFDIGEEIEAMLERYAEDDWDETDALMDMMEIGYSLEDFKYNNNRYEWAKRIAEEHGLI